MRRLLCISALLLMASVPLSARAADRDRTEAVRAAFGCDYVLQTHTLTEMQRQRVAQLSGRASAGTVTRYRPVCADATDARSAYVLTRTIRTLPQTLMVVVASDATIEKVEVLAFQEPAEYKGTARWYRGFEGRALNGDLNVQRAIPLMAGATITSRTTTQIVREVLALHTVLLGK